MDGEENVLVELIKYYADKAHPMRGSDLLDVAEYMISGLSAERRALLPFRNAPPDVALSVASEGATKEKVVLRRRVGKKKCVADIVMTRLLPRIY